MDRPPHAAFSSPMGSPSWSIAGSSVELLPDPIAANGAEDSPFRASTAPHPRNRKGEKVRAREWMVMESGGWSGIEEFGKHAIMKRVGLPARDLRMLDPMLSYPSTILGRERAIVVKLEHIKAIITANEVLVLKSNEPHVELFLRELQQRLASGSKTASETENVQETDQMDIRDINTQSNSSASFLNNDGLQQSTYQYGNVMIPDVEDDSPRPSTTSETSKVVSPKTLPFEFRALEICLECACRCLETETSTLVQEAHPALDELTSKISTLNLERVRQIKSRLVTISGRVQKVRDELEQLLDDDMDMAEMYLTHKLDQQELEDREARDDNDDYEPESNYECEQISTYKTKGSTSEAGGTVSPDTVELEMLLEAYFVQIEGTLNRLSALREYVDDTEDYINIMLDDKQNQLLQMGVILSTATLLSSAGITVVGMFGMNIHIALFDAAPIRFWQTSIATVVTCTVLFITSITWGRWKGLLSL